MKAGKSHQGSNPVKTCLIITVTIFVSLLLLPLATVGVQAAPGDMVLCSSNASGAQGNTDSYALAISPDGRYVAFTSPATNLLPGLTGVQQALRKDLETGEVKLASCNSSGIAATNGVFSPSISADGRYVAFSSPATNLLAGVSGSQVFRKDLQTGEVKLCSANSSGTQGDDNSGKTSMSSDARYVAFESDATNLGPVTTPARTNLFRKDLQTGEVKLVSSNASGTEGDQPSTNPSLSSDGRYVAFESDATDLVTGGTSGTQVFRKDLQTGEVRLCSAGSSGVQGNGTSAVPSMSGEGRYVAFESDATNLVTGVGGNQVFRKDLQTGEAVTCSTNASGAQGDGYSGSAAISPDGRFVAFGSNATNLVPGIVGYQVLRKDLRTGTVVLVSCNASGIQGDNNSFGPSTVSDGRYVAFRSDATNLIPGGTSNRQIFRKELQTPSTFYFAEGYTGGGFQEYLCLGNPNDTGTFAIITYMFPDGSVQEQEVGLGANSRATVNVNAVVGPDKQVSARVDCDLPIVAERPMYFDYQDRWTGGHDVVGATSTSDTWYFAEGYTGQGFDEWICVLNPGDTTADLTFFFQTQEEGEKTVAGFAVPAHSRQSFKANDLLGGGSYQTSLKLGSSQPVVVERPMYFDYQGTGGWGWTGGHCVTGASELATGYYFAEGATRGGFEEWLTIQNPGPAEITVHATYFLGSGTPIEKDYPVPPARRSTVYVPIDAGADQDVSVYLTSSQPFLAERPMYFNYQGMGAWGWTGGHCVIGATASSTDWFFAEGYTGAGFEEWLCIQNPGATDAAVSVTYYPEGGAAPIVREHSVAANSRYTIPVNVDAGGNLAISARVAADRPVIVERPMYFDYQGTWNGGHDVLGYTTPSN